MKVIVEIKERDNALHCRLRRQRAVRDTVVETEAGSMIFRSVRAGFNDADKTIIHDESGDVEFVYEETKGETK